MNDELVTAILLGYRPRTPEEFSSLSYFTKEELGKIGFLDWEGVNFRWHLCNLFLIPKSWHEFIPEGTALRSIMGVDTKAPVNDDARGGFLAYGIIRCIE